MKKVRQKIQISGSVILFFIFLFTCTSVHSQVMDTISTDYQPVLSLKELRSIKISTASKFEEKLSDAPATIIIITKNDIEQRGYAELSEMFDDLPGMDMARMWGDHYYKNYMRGFRNTIGDPYLVLVDGIPQNDLYYGINTVTMVSIPIPHILRVEIVYGPVSVVYGANAFMGVINIITENDKKEDGSYLNANISGSIHDYFINNFSFFYKKNDVRISVNARVEFGDINTRIDGNDFYWLRDEHYANKKLWGDYVNNPNVNPGKFSSFVLNRGLDVRIYLKDIEIGGRYLKTDCGLGVVYPGDRTLSMNSWPRFVEDIYAKYTKDITDKLNLQSIILYRYTGVGTNQSSVNSFNTQNTSSDTLLIGQTPVAPGEGIRLIDHKTQQTLNWEIATLNNITYSPLLRLAFTLGLEHEYKNLQKAYEKNVTSGIYPDSLDASSPDAYAPPLVPVLHKPNRIIWQENAIYLQCKYTFNKNNLLNLGIRNDLNSFYGTANTFRASFVKHFGNYSAKVLYGEAYQEPQPRNLFGSWRGSGSDPDLEPERSNTSEVSIDYSIKNFHTLISAYYIQYNNIIMGFKDGAKNVGTRNLLGFDYHIQGLINLPYTKQVKLWAYYSAILFEKEQKFDDEGNATEMGVIGDLAYHKIYFGATSVFNNNLSVNIRGRYIGNRKTVDTNPIDQVEGYFIADANILYKNLFVKGLGLGLKITNIFDTEYFHPGVREANSGTEPGHWEGKAWYGSKGWYNSLMPQPGRFVMLSLILER